MSLPFFPDKKRVRTSFIHFYMRTHFNYNSFGKIPYLICSFYAYQTLWDLRHWQLEWFVWVRPILYFHEFFSYLTNIRLFCCAFVVLLSGLKNLLTFFLIPNLLSRMNITYKEREREKDTFGINWMAQKKGFVWFFPLFMRNAYVCPFIFVITLINPFHARNAYDGEENSRCHLCFVSFCFVWIAVVVTTNDSLDCKYVNNKKKITANSCRQHWPNLF